MTRRDYDSTVARIAGNILSGVLNPATLADIGRRGRRSGVDEVVRGAVEAARAVVSEVRRTEPDDAAAVVAKQK